MNKQRVTGGEIVQSRAVKTREKILDTAMQVYSKKGYHNATVDEIAKSAGVSVGTAYRYFKDKKELLLATLEYGFENISLITGLTEKSISEKNIEQALIVFEKIHRDYYDLHEELEGLRHTDMDVRRLYDNVADSVLKEIHEALPAEIKRKKHSFEKLKMVIGLMENHCHYCVYDNPDENTIKFMRKKTIELINVIMT